MEVVNNNVESKKKIFEYLKSINVNSVNKHEEIELENFIASVVMIITSSSTLNSKEEEYSVYLLLQDKKDNKIYGKFYEKDFTDESEAEEHYSILKSKVNSFTDKDINTLLQL
ncbi:MAG: hypothetical protein SPF04_03015 [Bacilli bacterium]|nr:hypothetical protein [Bacilli bacterium]